MVLYNFCSFNLAQKILLLMEEYKKWECIVCGLIYDEAEGWPDDGIPPGTKWEDVPVDWVCPDCGVGKEDFDMVPVEGAGKSY